MRSEGSFSILQNSFLHGRDVIKDQFNSRVYSYMIKRAVFYARVGSSAHLENTRTHVHANELLFLGVSPAFLPPTNSIPESAEDSARAPPEPNDCLATYQINFYYHLPN